MSMTVFIFSLAIVGLYLIFTGLVAYAQIRRRRTGPVDGTAAYISIIAAARDEEAKIKSFIDSVLAQDFPNGGFELIIIDDGSDDRTAQIAEEAAKGHPDVRILRLHRAEGKKAALSHGIERARGEVVLISDADCRAGKNWLQAWAQCYRQSPADLTLGPVEYEGGKGLLDKLLQNEQMILNGITAGTAHLDMPVLAASANLAFRREAYCKLDDPMKRSYRSGDDMFLLESFRRAGFSVGWNALPGASVFTQAPKTLNGLMHQRARWAGKAGGYRNAWVMSVGMLIVMVNLLALALPVTALLVQGLWPMLICFWAIKLLAEFLLNLRLAVLRRKGSLLWGFPLMALLYPVYVFATLLWAVLGTGKWK